MAEETTTNTYEEARKQQLIENKKRLEELGILKISRNLSELSKSRKFKQREVKPKIRNAEIVEPRRSTRARNPIITYPSYLVWRRRRGRGPKWVLRNANIPKFKKRVRPETTLDNPAENEKTPPAKSNSQAEETKQSKEKTSTSKSNSQDKNTKKSEEIVTGTRRSTRLRN